MKVEVFKPKSTKLKKHIDCFYILNHSTQDGKTSYLTFPSVFTIVSGISNAEIAPISKMRSICRFKKNCFVSNFNAKFINPLFFQYEGDVKEITIYFKPLGINAFLEGNLCDYCSDKQEMFLPFDDYEQCFQEILAIRNKDLMLEKLESYWLGKLKGFRQETLGEAVNEIIDNPEIAIADVAKNNGVSHKQMIRLFKRYLCKTPTDFRKTVRFRKALNNSGNLSLTELGYLSNYFDQAHMIRDFRSLTGYPPKEFFNNLSTVDDKVNWIFIQNNK